ncbi:hypothetical protein F5I97DRAFT_1922592 [Phlebopus sp. FC_14]|nr:hypothetical protein F5I97DRAFT_1922592 [Phlebopus sp. FC_14]
MSIKEHASVTINIEHNIQQNFHNAKLTILLSMFITLILNVFTYVIHPWCNTVLGLLNLLLATTLPLEEATHGPVEAMEDQKSKFISWNIRTIYKNFDLNASTHVYVTCVRYCSTYALIEKDGQKVYPE